MKIENLYPIPSGAILDYAGSTAPNGFLLCYGQAISRTTYGSLFSALSTTYGSGDGSTTFNLPDCRGRTIAGKDNMGGTSANRLTSGGSGITGTTLGSSGGSETHNLSTAQMPSHYHNIYNYSSAYSNASAVASGDGRFGVVSNTVTSYTQAYTTSQGSGSAHQNTQPTIVFNKIIKI